MASDSSLPSGGWPDKRDGLEQLHALDDAVFADLEVVARQAGHRQAVAPDHGDVHADGADADAKRRRLWRCQPAAAARPARRQAARGTAARRRLGCARSSRPRGAGTPDSSPSRLIQAVEPFHSRVRPRPMQGRIAGIRRRFGGRSSMKRLGFGALLLMALASMISAQAPPTRTAGPLRVSGVASAPRQTFTNYCVECHGAGQAQGRPQHRAPDRPSRRPRPSARTGSTGSASPSMLEYGAMPPDDATRFRPTTSAPRRRRGSVGPSTAYEAKHAGDPGRVTVRRLTSAEYAYALRDLTGIDVKVGVDASSDSVGGEGFANFGDVQFVQDASRRAVSRSGQAGRRSRRHRRGPAGLLRGSRQDGPRAVGAEPDRAALRDQRVSRRLRRRRSSRSGSTATARRSTSPGTTSTASRSAIRPRRFAASRPRKASPAALPSTSGRRSTSRHRLSDPGDRGRLAAVCRRRPPTSRRRSPTARTGCDALVKSLIAWPSWFFARGDLAAGGAGDESPLVFDDTTLNAEPTHAYTLSAGTAARTARPLPPAPGPWTVHLSVDDAQSARPGVTPASSGATRASSLAPQRPAGRRSHGRPDRRGRGASARPDSVDAVASLGAAGRCRRHAGIRHEPRRHADRSRRLRDHANDVVRDRRAGRRQPSPSFRPTPSSAATGTP